MIFDSFRHGLAFSKLFVGGRKVLWSWATDRGRWMCLCGIRIREVRVIFRALSCFRRFRLLGSALLRIR